MMKFYNTNVIPLSIVLSLNNRQNTNHFVLKFATSPIVLKASCLMLEIKEFRCYEAKIEESEKTGSLQESKPEVSWVRLPEAAGLFTFLYFCLITSKFLHSPIVFAFDFTSE